MNFAVIIHTAEEGGYWVEVPALEGCYGQGETVEEALEDIRGAIESHLIALVDDGQAIPVEDRLLIASVSVETPANAA